jgi:uncharacterized membrane-anchored protein YitT (DUF2179 family)
LWYKYINLTSLKVLGECLDPRLLGKISADVFFLWRMDMKQKRMLLELLMVVFGNLLYASGVVFFIMPLKLITGGTTGIALFVHQYLGLPVPTFVFAFNLIMFVLGFAVLGRKFAFTTLISTFCYPIALELMQKIAGDYILTDDLFLCTLFGGICIGVSIALVIRAGASTGGMDIPPLILNKFFRTPVSISLYIADCIILALQAVFNDKEKILYGLVLVIVYTLVIDKLLMLGSRKVQVKVISAHHARIKDAILTEIDRGVTLLYGRTGFLEKETEILLTVVSSRELSKVEKLIRDIDEEAFVMISHVSEVRGKGFSAVKKYITK